MSNDEIQESTKDGLRYLKGVFEYRSRTIAVLFVQNTQDLEANWEEAQFELSSKYQYQGDNERIWDYYLAICCNFDEGSFSDTLRFRIENDRFCCRKVFIFNQSINNFLSKNIIDILFPKIHSPKKIEILEPSKFIPTLEASLVITKDFFIRSLEDKEIENLATLLIAENSINVKNS